MDEGSLRWQARIGSLKWLSLLIILFAGIGLLLTINKLITALNNPREPQLVTIEQVVNGSVASSQYVMLDGLAMYDTGYEETEGDRVVETYYLLVDEVSGYLVVVKATSVDVSSKEYEYIRLAGMTQKPPTDLKSIIREDFAFYGEMGFLTTADLYIAEGEKPSSVSSSAALGVVLFAFVILGIVPLFFPTTVFAPKPVELVAEEAVKTKGKGSGIFATGRFIKLKNVKPKIEIGKGKQKFTTAVANIIPMEQGPIMVYIHHVVRYNFIPVSKTHWGVFLSPKNVETAEPGLHYGWRDRPAVQINYVGRDQKKESLLLTFDKSSDQAFFVKFLREKRFRVGTGIPSI